MKVSIKLYSILTQNLSEEVLSQHPDGIRSGVPFEVALPAGSTLSDLMTYLSLAENMIKIVFVNGRHQDLTYQLQPEDQVGIFPPIAGG
jgi:molybdopterin synthase sulfur carrier subunit